MDDNVTTMLRELCEAFGVSGYESEVKNLVRRYAQPHTSFQSDGLGSLVCEKKGKSDTPRVMLAAHMDEIGFIVTYITDEGFIKFQTIGGWWEQVMLAQRVTVRTKKGDIPGVIGAKPPHILTPDERKKMVDKKDMFIDVGAESKDQAKSLGITPGDPIVPVSPFTVMANKKTVMAKAFDNRAGVGVMLSVIKMLAKTTHPNTVFGVATVQEEVGLRGATTSPDIVNPDVALVLDVDIAGDTPGIEVHQAQAKLGKGPSVVIYDSSMIPNTKLRDLVIDVAEANNIPFQFNSTPGGGTDAGKIHLHKSGVPTLVLGIPTRYIHSHAGIIHLDDYENTVKLITEVVKRLDSRMVNTLRE